MAMLKRLWIVVSVLWDLLIVLFPGNVGGRDTLVIASVPWIVGAVVWVSWVFIRAGRRTGTTSAIARRRY